MKKTSTHLAAIAAAAILTAACSGKPGQQFNNADTTLSATFDGTSWRIADKDGREPVDTYDSMRVLETGDQGHPKTVVYYSGDQSHQYQYYSTMQLFSEQHMDGTRKSGRWAAYYPDGSLWSETSYDSLGLESGPYRSMRKGGIPAIIGQYSAGHPVGRWEFYGANGDLAGTKTYDADGTLIAVSEAPSLQ